MRRLRKRRVPVLESYRQALPPVPRRGRQGAGCMVPRPSNLSLAGLIWTPIISNV